MKLRNILIFLSLAALAAVSCKKSEEDVTLFSFSGDMEFELPAYVHYGETYDIVPKGVSRKDETPERIGYSFYDSLHSKTDTLRKETDPAGIPAYSFKVDKDTLGTFSATCAAFASGFTRKTLTRTFVIIKAGFNEGSIKGVKFASGTYRFTDARDGREYYALDVDGTSWMCENLAYAGAGKSLIGEPALDDLFGRYYSYADTQNGICPDGWKMPSDADWVALANKFSGQAPAVSPNDVRGAAGSMMTDAYYNGSKMWEYWPAVNMTNASGLCAMPLGYGTLSGDRADFSGFTSYAVFWTADVSGDFAVSRYIYQDNDTLFAGLRDKEDFLASVRCIKQ